MSERREFYIGFAAVAPRGLARFRSRVVSGLVVLGLALAATIVFAQQRFVPSVFEFLQYQEFSGVIEERPYPALLVRRPGKTAPGQEYSRYLLTVPGKQSAGPEVEGLDGRAVRLEGALIYLDGDTMLEVKEGSVEQLEATVSAGPPPVSLGEVSLEGEIVDTKCWLGVMNPGKGKVHKDCAIRCISGGSPPALLTHDERGGRSLLLLVGRDGRPLNQEVLDIVAAPLRVTGEVKQNGSTRYLYAEPDELQPLRE